ncbi:hypothetical protein ABVT39_005415 [Epinephelus coioides]
MAEKQPSELQKQPGNSGEANDSSPDRPFTARLPLCPLLNKKLTAFICKDMRPVSIVEGDGFQEFIHEVNPRYPIPSRGTVSNRIVKLYENVKTRIEDMNVALTTERRTSLATDAYVTV